MKQIGSMVAVGLLGWAAVGWGQEAAPAPAPTAAQLNLQVLAETLRAASTFHDLVKGLNVQKNLNPEGASGPASSLNRTAAIVGAGAGTGAAIGEWSGGQKAVLIGVIAGAAGGLIVDQVLRHQAARAEARAQTDQAQTDQVQPAPAQPLPPPKGFRPRPVQPVQ